MTYENNKILHNILIYLLDQTDYKIGTVQLFKLEKANPKSPTDKINASHSVNLELKNRYTNTFERQVNPWFD